MTTQEAIQRFDTLLEERHHDYESVREEMFKLNVKQLMEEREIPEPEYDKLGNAPYMSQTIGMISISADEKKQLDGELIDVNIYTTEKSYRYFKDMYAMERRYFLGIKTGVFNKEYFEHVTAALNPAILEQGAKVQTYTEEEILKKIEERSNLRKD